jgi:hypothetical protein
MASCDLGILIKLLPSDTLYDVAKAHTIGTFVNTQTEILGDFAGIDVPCWTAKLSDLCRFQIVFSLLVEPQANLSVGNAARGLHHHFGSTLFKVVIMIGETSQESLSALLLAKEGDFFCL